MLRFFLSLLLVSSASQAYARSAEEIVALLEATPWGWSDVDNVCQEETRVLSFNASRSEMVNYLPDTGDAPVYHVLNFTPNSVIMQIEGEHRRTPQGTPVIWELRFGGDDAICWHALHWPLLRCTPFLVRCKGDYFGS